MDTITKAALVAPSVSYLQSFRHITEEKLAEEIGVDHSTISKWKKYTPKQKVTQKNFLSLLSVLEQQVIEEKEICEFCEFLIEILKKYGYDEYKCRSLTSHGNVLTRLNKLLSGYEGFQYQVQDAVLYADVFSRFRYLCHSYHPYFQEAQVSIFLSEAGRQYFRNWLYYEGNPCVPEANYLILSFSGGYRIALILSNHDFRQEYQTYEFKQQLEALKFNNHLNMLIIFTDHTISGEMHHEMHQNFNITFLTLHFHRYRNELPADAAFRTSARTEAQQQAYLYADLMFRRFFLQFASLKDELLFAGCTAALPQKGSEESPPLLRLNELSSHLIRNVYRYPYPIRHSIYYERNRLASCCQKWLKDHEKEKFRNVIELNFLSGMISGAIESQCENLYLADRSRSGIEYVEKVCLYGRRLAPHVRIHLAETYIDGIPGQLRKQLQGKADLIIVSLGAASYTSHPFNFLRHLLEWLSPDGMLFVSFVNQDSILFTRQQDLRTGMTLAGMTVEDHYLYSLPDQLSLPLYLKCYSPLQAEGIIHQYCEETSQSTYPFLSLAISSKIRDPEILSEIREYDKKNAGSNQHGHYISICGTHNRMAREGDGISTSQISLLIRSHLEREHLQASLFDHSPVTSQDQMLGVLHSMRSLGNTGNALPKKMPDRHEYHIVKTVILREKAKPEKHYCHVLPASRRLDYNQSVYELMPEREVLSRFGNGYLSPFIALPEVIAYTGFDCTLVLHRELLSDRPYIMFSQGKNTASAIMKLSDFPEVF